MRKKAMYIYIIFIFLIIIIIASLVFDHETDKVSDMETVEVNELNLINVEKDVLTLAISDIVSDIRLVTESEYLSNFLDDNSKSNRLELEEYFLAFSKGAKFYNQIRFIDTQGYEIVRIDHNNGKYEIVSENELQNKKGRYYFDESYVLEKGQVYMSQLDLNIERGEIEIPFKPMVRFGIPVYSSSGDKKGIVVLNYSASRILTQLRREAGSNLGEISLVNKNGYYLSSPDKTNDFGFMFEDDVSLLDKTLKKEIPEEWEIIKNSPQSQFYTGDGSLYTTVKLQLKDVFLKSGEFEVITNDSWIFVSKISSDIIQERYVQIGKQILKIGIMLTVILLSLAFIINSIESKKLATYEKVINQAHAIANGDYTANVVPVSDKDELGKALETMTNTLRNTSKVAEQIAKGNLDVIMDEKSDNDLLAQSINRMAESLKDMKVIDDSLMNCFSDGVSKMDLDTTITVINDAALKMTGNTREEVIGKMKCGDLYKTQLCNTSACPLEQVKLTKKAIVIKENVLKTIDGQEMPLRMIVGPLLDSKDELVGIFEIVQDITEDIELNNRLSEMVKESETASKAKSSFLANMSHEIRTPMSVIIGMSGLALDKAKEAGQREYLTKINYAANSLLEIINDILDYSKVESGEMEVEQINFYLDDAIGNIVGIINIIAVDKGVELLTDIDSSIPPVMIGDPLRLSQIINNLLSNAIKFTNKGAIILSAEVKAKNDEKVWIEFSVKDDGIGITEVQMQNLFDPFIQADNSTTRKYGGSGLGLAICKNLCNLMGGSIKVKSEYGVGSTFSFKIPFGVGENIEKDEYQIAVDLSGKKVLVVDDNIDARKIISKLLNSMNFEVLDVESGDEALEKIKEADMSGSSFDVVLLDWKMPGKDGIEVCKEILMEGLTVKPKLILVTAYDLDIVKRKAISKGFDDVLIKPVRPSTLFDALMIAFGKRERTVKAVLDIEIPNFEGAKILLTEDNELNREIAIELLGTTGVDVTVAKNGKEALEIVKSKDFDLVLMDIQMPVMDGLSATREIRKINRPEINELPIIAMTAHAMSGDREKSIEAGMNDHVTKPIEPEKFYSVLKKYIVIETIYRRKYRANIVSPEQSQFETIEIKGIDVAEGLIHVSGNENLYLKLLGKFPNHFCDAAESIQTNLYEGNMIEASRMIHTVKAVSGSIGAIELQQVAMDLEHVIQQTDGDYENLLKVFKNTLMESIRNIEDFLVKKESNTKPMVEVNRHPGKMEFLELQINELKIALDKSEPRPCQKIILELETYEWPTEVTTKLTELRGFIDRYKFSEAGISLQSIMEEE